MSKPKKQDVRFRMWTVNDGKLCTANDGYDDVVNLERLARHLNRHRVVLPMRRAFGDAMFKRGDR